MTGIAFWIFLVLVGAFDVIGLIELVKSIMEAIKKKDGSWKWPILSVVLSLLVAISKGLTPGDALFGSVVNDVAFTFFTVLAFIEIFGYNIIVKWLFAVVDAVVEWARGKKSD